MKKKHEMLSKNNRSQALVLLLSEVLVGVFLSATSLLVLAKLTRGVLNDRYFNIDSFASSLLYSIRSPELTSFMRLISFLGNEALIYLLFVLVVVLFYRKYIYEAILLVLAFGLGYVLSIAIKFLIARPRPTISPLIIENLYAFPSGHTMNAFVFYGLISFYVFRFSRNKRLSIVVSCISLLLVFLIGISRIYLGVHYVTDVIAGLVAGFWWVVSIILIEKTIRFYKLYKSSKA